MRVALSGYYGFGNLGDEALLAGLLRQLRAMGAEPLVLSGDPAATSKLHDVEAVHRYRGLPGALRRADAVISGGGGLLQDGTSGRSLDYYLGVLRLAALLGRKRLVYGQSLGPLSESGRRKVARTLRNVPLAVRDQPSLRLLSELGLSAELVADPALLLPVAQSGGPDVLLVPRAPYREFTAALLAAGEEALSVGKTVAVLALQPDEDAVEAGFLLAGLPAAQPLAAADHLEAASLVASASLVISVRLHALIFAAAAGRPHIGLVYDPKVQGFLEQSGGRALTAPVDTVSLLGMVNDPPAVDGSAIGRLGDRLAVGRHWLERQLVGGGQ